MEPRDFGKDDVGEARFPLGKQAVTCLPVKGDEAQAATLPRRATILRTSDSGRLYPLVGIRNRGFRQGGIAEHVNPHAMLGTAGEQGESPVCVRIALAPPKPIPLKTVLLPCPGRRRPPRRGRMPLLQGSKVGCARPATSDLQTCERSRPTRSSSRRGNRAS